MNKDLTEGKPAKVLWGFCLPLFGSIIFQQLYNIADSLVAGKFIGENALAAVGNSYEITLIFIAFAFGCNMGCSVIVSQLFGAKDYGKMKSAVSTACIFSALLCAVLMIAGILGCAPLLRLIRTHNYTWIFISGGCPLCFSTILPQGFSPLWEIPERRSAFWPYPPAPILLWTSCL